MNKSFRVCFSNIKNVIVNRRLENSFLNQIYMAEYSKRSKDILRNRYVHRNKDGSFKEFNETVTILPKEYEEQGLFL